MNRLFGLGLMAFGFGAESLGEGSVTWTAALFILAGLGLVVKGVLEYAGIKRDLRDVKKWVSEIKENCVMCKKETES